MIEIRKTHPTIQSPMSRSSSSSSSWLSSLSSSSGKGGSAGHVRAANGAVVSSDASASSSTFWSSSSTSSSSPPAANRDGFSASSPDPPQSFHQPVHSSAYSSDETGDRSDRAWSSSSTASASAPGGDGDAGVRRFTTVRVGPIFVWLDVYLAGRVNLVVVMEHKSLVHRSRLFFFFVGCISVSFCISKQVPSIEVTAVAGSASRPAVRPARSRGTKREVNRRA